MKTDFYAKVCGLKRFLSPQLLEANSMKGAVQLLDIRPEQLTSNDLGEQQVVVGVGGCSLSNAMQRRERSPSLLGLGPDRGTVLRHQPLALALSVLLVLSDGAGQPPPARRHHPALLRHASSGGCRV